MGTDWPDPVTESKKQRLLLEPIEGKQRLLFAVTVGVMRRELCVRWSGSHRCLQSGS